MKLKQFLIHLLGGATEQDIKELRTTNCKTICKTSFNLGKMVAYKDIKSYAKSFNGIPADDWCKAVYDALCTRIKEVEQQSTAIANEAAPTEAPVSEGCARGEKSRNCPLLPMEKSPRVPAKRWSPKGSEYYYIDNFDDFKVFHANDYGTCYDFARFFDNNCFKTEALAKAALDEIRDVLKFAKKE